MLSVLRVDSALTLLRAPVDTCEWCGGRAQHQVLESVHTMCLFSVRMTWMGGTKYLDRCTLCGRVNELSTAQVQTGGSSGGAR